MDSSVERFRQKAWLPLLFRPRVGSSRLARMEFLNNELGLFQRQPVPDGTWCWTLERPCDERWASSGSMKIHLMTVSPEFPTTAFMAFVHGIARGPDAFLEAAVQSVRDTLERDSKRFGVSDEQARAILSQPIEGFVFEEPNMVFYSDRTWSVHFQAGNLPICDPHGLMVHFEGVYPVTIKDISEAESF
jgi:hypothetical protein